MNPKDKAKNLPTSPGVYLMKDSRGSIIYVGKSKNLRNRVSSYFLNSKNHSNKVKKLVHHLTDFDYILTDTEFEAFMLECKLIKQIQPLYNRLMKTPQSYTYIAIRMDEDLDRIGLARDSNEKGCRYFGPFPSKNTAEKAIQGLKEFFKIDCNQHSHHNVPCLNYSLEMCNGMCFESSAREQYQRIIAKIIRLLEGNDTSILKEMNQRMLDASAQFEFEKAARLRDGLEAIRSLLQKEKVIEFAKEDQLIVMMDTVSDRVLKFFIIKRNKILFSKIAEIGHTDPNQLVVWIKSKLFASFKRSPQLGEVGKDEIDEAQIIYSYLKNSGCSYFLVPEEWLYTENGARLQKAIMESFHLEKSLSHIT